MALALVQSAGASSTTSATATLGAGCTAGNTIAISAGWNQASVLSFFNVTLPGGSYQSFASVTSAGDGLALILYKVAVGGEQNFTVSWTSGSGPCQIEVMEFSGLGSGPAFDAQASTEVTPAGTALPSMATGTLVGTNDIIVGSAMATGTISAEAWSASFNSVSHSTNQLLAAYLFSTTTTSKATVASWTTSRTAAGLLIAIQPAPIPVAQTFTGKWNVGGVAAQTYTGKWNVGGSVTQTYTGKWNVAGPVGTFTPRCEVAWTTDPLVRPGALDWSQLSDVSDGVRNLDIKRGTKIRSASIEAGTASAVVDNSNRNLDPSNVASPLWPNVQPRKRVRYVVNAGGNDYVLHTGFVERWPIEWARKTGAVTLSSSDLFGLLAGAYLPPSVLDLETRATSPVAYWPMGETNGQTTEDVVSTWDGVYATPVQSSGDLTQYDARKAPIFGRPTGSANISQNMVVTPFPANPTVTVAGWFRWQLGDDVTMEPAVLMLQDTAAPLTFTSSAGHFSMFLAVHHTAGDDRGQLSVVIRDTGHFSQNRSVISYHLLDGNPHFFVLSIEGATKTLTGWVDGNNQILLPDTGAGGSTALASMDVAGMLAAIRLFAAGWGIVWDSSSAQANSAALGQCAYWNRKLTDAEVLAMYQAGVDAWDGDTTGARLNRVCDVVGVDAGDRMIDTGTQTCGPTILGSQNFLSYVRKINATEGGTCSVNGDGKIDFTARDDLPTVEQTFSDAPATDGGVPYGPIKPDFSYDRIINTVTITREGGADQTVTNAASIANYGPLSGPVGGNLDTLSQNADQARVLGARLVEKFSDPKTYIPTVELNAVDDFVTLDAMVGLDIGDATEIFARPAGGGAAIDQLAAIEALNHKFSGTFGDWKVAYSFVEIAPPDVSDGESATVIPTDISDGESATVIPTDISDGGHA